MPKFRAPKRRHVDLGSAYVDVAAAASEIASTEGAIATAAAIAVSSSTDIIFEILSRLPVKTLCRFRCTCKQWHSLVSEPAFIAAHESRAEPLLVGRFPGASLRLMDMDGNVVRTTEGVHPPPRMFCTSRDGIACFAFPNRSAGLQVIDMATGEMLLTKSNQRTHPDRRPSYGPRSCSFGFGRTAVSQVYKVVRLIGSYWCQVLTLGGDGAMWRQAQPPTTPASRADYHTSVAIQGVLHFLVSDKNIVLCFDLESEEWTKTIKCPGQGMDDSLKTSILVRLNGVAQTDPGEGMGDNLRTSKTIIAELNGALCFSQTDLYIDRYSCTDIWLLNGSDNKEVWSKAYTIRTGRTVDLVKPLRVMRDGRKLLFCYIHLETKLPVLQVYDPLANTCREVMVTTTGCTDIMGICKLPLDRFI